MDLANATKIKKSPTKYNKQKLPKIIIEKSYTVINRTKINNRKIAKIL